MGLFANGGALPAPIAAPAPKKRVLLSEKLGLIAADTKAITHRSWEKKPGVPNSEDIERILALPRRPRPTDAELAAYVEKWTTRLLLAPEKQPKKCRCRELRPGFDPACITRLRPLQAWYFEEADRLGMGIVGHIALGGGKTGINILLPMVLPVQQGAVLFIPASLRNDFARDFELWAQHWRVPNLAGGGPLFYPDRPVLRVMSYSQLGHPRAATWFIAHKPDLIMADECQHFANRGATSTNRFLRYCATAPYVYSFSIHSGSLISHSVDNVAHLAALALRENSPFPIDPSEVRNFCEALDPLPWNSSPSALKKFCNPGEPAHSGYRRRIVESPGVIVSDDAELTTKLSVLPRKVALPEAWLQTLATVRKRQVRPDGEELVEATELWATCHQMASGFYHRWKFPRGESPELIEEWFKKRQAWNRELRLKLEYRRDHMDSPKLCELAAERFHTKYEGALPVWDAETWPAWRDIENAVQHQQDSVWIDDFLARDAATWAKEKPGIVWTQHGFFGRRVAKLAGIPYYGEGEQARIGIMQEDGSRSIVAGQSHTTGRNLQMFRRNLIAELPSKGEVYDQCIGRTHRYGQKADLVEVFVYQHTEEVRWAFQTALRQQRFVYGLEGKMGKLIVADVDWA